MEVRSKMSTIKLRRKKKNDPIAGSMVSHKVFTVIGNISNDNYLNLFIPQNLAHSAKHL